MRKYILLLLFLCLHCIARGQTSYTYSYWLDNDYTTLQKFNASSSKWHIDLDMSQKAGSLHSLHLQVADKSGNLSSPMTRFFIIEPMKSGTSANVWFDNNPSTMKSLSIDGNAMWVDAKDLPDGFHLLHVQVNGSAPSSPQTSMFIKVPQTQGVDYMTCLLYVDDTLFKQEKVSVSGGLVNWSVDANSLSQGLHKANVVVVTPSGAATSAYSVFFLRVPNAAEFAAMKCYYAIDGHDMTSATGNVTNGLFHFDLDLSELKDGLHSITYMLNDGKGTGTSTNTQFFMKTPLGGYGIIQYMYWLNDQYDKAVVKTVDPRQETVRMLSLLPINQQPIRSSCFQFTVKDGKPVVYAKNDLHVRFYDASGRFVDAQEQYVDENVMQQVTNVKLLESGKPSTATKPAENKITWYKVMAERGDSLTFKVRQSCTLNLFSPSGKELYSASAPEILEYGGAYANEDGTYYVAVHDAKSKNENNVTVDYQHIDKYAVLDYTPKEIGITESYVYINLDGNGLDKLESVRLVNGSKIISANKITVKSKASAELQFAVYGEESPGTYDLIFNFRDGQETRTVTISQAVRFANPDFGDMAIEITPTRRAGFPYPVILSVKNTGNVSKLYLPFNIGATFNEAGEMPSGDLNSCSWTEMYTMNFDVLFDSEDEEYSPYTLTDNLIGTGHPGVVLHGFIPEIGPQETKEFILGFVGGAHAKFNLYAWTGKALNDLRDSDASDMSIYSVWDYITELKESPNNSLSRNLVRKLDIEPLPDVLDLADELNEGASRVARNTIATGLAIGSYENELRLRGIQGTYDAYGDFARDVLGDYEEDVREHIATPGQIADVLGVPEWAQRLLGLQDNQSRCRNQRNNESPIDIYAPGDPNDIIGYTAESGSKYMREGTTDVYYTIEFENDPEIANASAHTIVVLDTLDTNRFDLSSFAAKSVKLGNKVMAINGEKSFSKRTIDLRPEIDVIGQVSLSLDEQKGIAKWTIESLDPMSMEPTIDVMQGVLPVNVSGNGLGEVVFDIKLKPGMADGESVSNRAGIVFDQEGTIMTPVWTNIIDGTLPVSRIADICLLNDTTAAVSITANDEGSGLWCYDVYMQKGNDAEWQRVAAHIPADTVATVKLYDGIEHHFYSVARDMAGNVEQKEARSEFTLTVSEREHGDVNGDGAIDVADIADIIDTMARGTYRVHADANNDGAVDVADIAEVISIMAARARAAAAEAEALEE